MNWTGKIIGFFIGLFFGNPFILIIAIFIGHLFDRGYFQKWLNLNSSRHHSIQDIFFNCTFTIIGYVAKSDGRISENEIYAARQVMNQMGLDEKMKREAIRLFNEGKQPDFNLQLAIQQLKKACWHRPNLLRIFLEIQIQMAYADGTIISEKKRQTLQYIFNQFGLSGFNFSNFEARFRAEQNYQRYREGPQYHTTPNLNDAYQILGISAAATEAEIKKAYRRAMSANHPDKLMSKGLPPEMIKMATQKTQRIKKAYEQIIQSRKYN